MAVYNGYNLTDLETGRVRHLRGEGGCHYRLADGSTIRAQCTAAWCNNCRDFVNAEAIETRAALEAVLAQLKDPRRDGPLLAFMLRDPDTVRMMIEEKTEQLRQSGSRLSPPKCITCGSADLIQLQFEQPTMHPETGRPIRIDIADFEFSRLAYAIILNTEGDVIERNDLRG